MPEPQSNLLVLEKRYRRLMVLTVCLIAAMLAQTAYTMWATRNSRTNGEILRAHGLVITDDTGTARVVIGAPLQYTKRHMYGLFIADATGQERGGYVTDDQGGNAMLTLDGQKFQTVLLLAEPSGGTIFKIWDQQHSSITMGANDKGPFLNLKREGEAVFAQPPGNALVSDLRPLFRY
jgi:hypothetical protein